ncbi:Helicase associated domain protein [Phaeodactylibacter xiamenensis]|uniref:helicase associated domain-containing protein n=1 Tax=Phaeodactylibacter xiamenensis TaxID=1524460 RepID=UPI003CCC0A4C
MKVDFIGHGLQKTAEKTVGDYLCSSFNDPKYNNFIGFSAFTTYSGLKVILPYIAKNAERFEQLKFYLGIAEQGTTKEALQALLENNIKSYYYHSDHNIMHQKVYYFFGEKYHRLLLGSANLTNPGLFGTIDTGNIEGSIKIDFTSNDNSGQKVVNQIFDYLGPIINLTNDFTQELTQEAVDDLVNKKKIKKEWELSDKEKAEKKPKSPRKKLDLSDLGKLKTKDHKAYEYKITQYYLNTWDDLFEEFKEYKGKYNSVTISRDPEFSSLYTWYRKQKIFYSNGEIPDRHLRLLQEAGFYFGDHHELLWAKAWEDKYQELLKYYHENGHSWVKRRKDKKDPLKSLSDWTAMQRTYYRQEKLDDYRVERLEEIDFIWEPPSFGMLPDDDSWLERFLELQQFKKKNGHCHPPQVNPDGTPNKLGRWVNDQMHLKNNGRKHRKTGERIYLDPIREEYLTDLGVDWDYELNKHKKSFEEQVQAFLEFRKKHPNLKPPTGTFKKEREWKAQMKHRFEKLPDWKQKRLKEEKII